MVLAALLIAAAIIPLIDSPRNRVATRATDEKVAGAPPVEAKFAYLVGPSGKAGRTV
jgi:hypothetical protein